jgi:hypothetical protein
MQPLRALIASNRLAFALMLAFALAMKALVPAGFMVSSTARTLTLEICADASGQRLTKQVTIGQTAPHAADLAKADMAKKPCTFAAHAAPLLSGADGWLLALALAFILALGYTPRRTPRFRRATYLLPPASGPPALA